MQFQTHLPTSWLHERFDLLEGWSERSCLFHSWEQDTTWAKNTAEYWISINACNLQWIYRSTKRHQNDIKILSNSKQGCSLQSHLPKGLDSSRYATNLRKYITFFKDMFGKFFCHLQFWFIQSTKLTLKCVTKCWLDKTNNRNRSMNAITRKVSNQHDKVDD